MKDINIYFNYFNDPHPARASELHECIVNNIENPYITKMLMYIDPDTTVPSFMLESSKIKIVDLGHRPTYAEFMDDMEDGAINIISNLDIYYDESIAMTVDMSETDAYAMIRYNVLSNGRVVFQNWSYAQDAWVFNGKPKGMKDHDYTLGVLGGDNRILAIMREAGYNVSSPSSTFKIYHLHNFRNPRPSFQKHTIKGEYSVVQPT